MTESFLGTALSLAWWDLSLSLKCGPGEPIRLIQGLALWRFVTGSDGRTRMVAIAGEQLEAEVRGWLIPPRAGPSFCGKCGKPMKPGAKFCGNCGAKVASPRCRECSKPLDSDAKFCPQCGHPAE